MFYFAYVCVLVLPIWRY